MRSCLLLVMGAVLIGGGCRSVPYQTADSATVESAVFSSEEEATAAALAEFLRGRLIEGEHGPGATEAAAAYRRASELLPGIHALYSRLAVHSIYLRAFDEALESIETSYAADPSDYIRVIDLAAMYHLVGRKQDAVTYYTKSLDLVATNTAVYVALAGILFDQSEDQKALELLDRGFPVVSEPSILTAYLYQQARQFVSEGELDSATACFTLLGTWHEDDQAEIHYLIGELYVAQARFKEALQAFRRAISWPNAPAAAFLRLGALLFEQDAFDDATDVLRQGAERFPEQASFPYALGGLYADGGLYEQAAEAYQAAIQLATEHLNARKPGRDSLSGDYLTENMLIALAATQQHLGRIPETEETLRTTLVYFPQSHIAMNFLAYLWAEENTNLEEAYALSQKSLALDPGNGAYLDTLGWIYYRKGQLDLALDYLNQAQDVLGPDPEIILHFGDVHDAKGNREKALAYWQDSLERDPRPENRAWEQLERAGEDPRAILGLPPLPAEDPPTETTPDVKHDDQPDMLDEPEEPEAPEATAPREVVKDPETVDAPEDAPPLADAPAPGEETDQTLDADSADNEMGPEAP